jgi:hypothetical protein
MFVYAAQFTCMPGGCQALLDTLRVASPLIINPSWKAYHEYIAYDQLKHLHFSAFRRRRCYPVTKPRVA